MGGSVVLLLPSAKERVKLEWKLYCIHGEGVMSEEGVSSPVQFDIDHSEDGEIMGGLYVQ